MHKLTIEVEGDRAIVTGPVEIMREKFPEVDLCDAGSLVTVNIYDPIPKRKEMGSKGAIHKAWEDMRPREDFREGDPRRN